MGNLLIKYPTRSRPKEFLFALDKYVSLLSGKHRVEIIVSADWGDKTMMDGPELDRAIMQYELSNACVHIERGDSTSKIEACNADMDKTKWQDWDVVLLASDDMIPQVQGYDDIIFSEMGKHFPDTDGALFFSDGTNCFTSNLCTITIYGRKYYDRFGYLYHPDYKSFWCDNEQTDVGQILGKMIKVDQVIIKNEHPMHKDLGSGANGTFTNDELYKKNNRFFKSDEAIYNRRKAMNFGLTPEAASNHTEAPADAARPVLSILIPTIPERLESFEFLHATLKRQAEPYGGLIEIITDASPKGTLSIGAKRQRLYELAKGKYAVQIDDDDGVPEYFIERIMQALENAPDCIGYKEMCLMDGALKYACHSNRFKDWGNNPEGFDYARTIFFKDVIRTDIARQVRVRDIRFGEDHQFSRDLKSSGLLKTEVYIDDVMYFYTHNTMSKQEHRERYGVK